MRGEGGGGRSAVCMSRDQGVEEDCAQVFSYGEARGRCEQVCLPRRSGSSRSIPVSGLPAFSRSEPILPWFLNGGLPLQCTAYIRQPSEYISDAGSRTSSSAYSGAAMQ